MEVGHGLSAVSAVVDYQPIAAFLQSHFFGDFSSFEQEMPEQLLVATCRFRNARNGLLWHDEDVSRSLGRNVAKGQDKVVLVHNLRRDLARDDLFKQGHGTHQIINAQFTPGFSAPRQWRR